MKLTKYHLIKISAFVLSLAVIINIWFVPQKTLRAAQNADSDMKGVWVSLIYNMDYPVSMTTDASVLKKYADDIIDDCADIGINNIFLQVRAVSDSIYPSQIYPWSKYISGTQGKAPDGGFDPLAYWVDECHKKGIKIHAWINPYRITTGKDEEFASLASSNPAVLHPEYVSKGYDDNYYFDPGIPEVREMVIAGAVEIAANYNVDGIHMDDYFYPSKGLDDDAVFAMYGSGDKGLWRLENVNTLVRELGAAVKAVNPDIIFGISPSGIWANKSNNPLGSNTNGMESYYGLYADTRAWALDGLIDYIAPQIYWNIGYDIADYGILTEWWANTLKNSPTKLYIGMADYKINNSDGIWNHDGVGEISRQLALNDTIDKIDGEIHFRYGNINDVPGLRDMLKSHYARENANNSGTTAYINKAVKMTLNGSFFFPTESDSSPLYPITFNDSTYLPARAIAEALGAKVDWDPASNTVIIESGNTVNIPDGTGIYPNTIEEITVVKNGIKIVVDGKETECLDAGGSKTEPFIYKDRTYIPVRAIASALGAEVDYIDESKTVVINRH
ncbi:MAG: family 10 glycosylhydrolase [Oscillospiraceae bacterium]|nr:family 10 glycosylhydrolase [Oscillospiraceae bacterium]